MLPLRISQMGRLVYGLPICQRRTTYSEVHLEGLPKGCPVLPGGQHDGSYGASPRCRNIWIRPVSGCPSALRCTASDAVR